VRIKVPAPPLPVFTEGVARGVPGYAARMAGVHILGDGDIVFGSDVALSARRGSIQGTSGQTAATAAAAAVDNGGSFSSSVTRSPSGPPLPGGAPVAADSSPRHRPPPSKAEAEEPSSDLDVGTGAGSGGLSSGERRSSQSRYALNRPKSFISVMAEFKQTERCVRPNIFDSYLHTC
jgi:hypothetical protein